MALWFATLFGLGFLVLPGHAFERIVQASGISAIIPAAGPPLGFTARLLVSVGAAIAGALAGYSAARAIAPRREQDEETRARRESRRERTEAQMQSLPEVTRRRPLSAMTDLGPPMDAPVSQEEAAAPLWAQEPEEDFAPEFVPELEIEPAIELDAIKIVAEELPQADVGLQVLPSPVAGVESPRRETRADELNLPSDPEADLSRMGVVQLAERLGIAMQRRAARPKSPPPAALAELATYLTGAKPAASPAQPTPSARQAPSAPQIPATQNVAPLPVAPPAPASRVEPLAAAERILGRASTASVPEPAPVPAPPPRMAQEIEAFDEEDYDD
ncbi:MAG TPA: hypothetical protein VEZ26_08570, partial [Sphingomonadaceae bacterium]|nr:hypothetical protein [Sphingomonadaceae bacterium]